MLDMERRKFIALVGGPLAKICARIDYVSGLQENLKGQERAALWSAASSRPTWRRTPHQCTFDGQPCRILGDVPDF
jgi:hypothetical protein